MITFWEYHKKEGSDSHLSGFFMTDAIEAPNMESELIEASNGDIFFFTKKEDGKIGVEILKID